MCQQGLTRELTVQHVYLKSQCKVWGPGFRFQVSGSVEQQTEKKYLSTNKISIKISFNMNIKISINMLSGVLVGHCNQPSFFRSNIVHIRNNGGAVVHIRIHETEHKTKRKTRRKNVKTSATGRVWTGDLLAGSQILLRLSYGGCKLTLMPAAYPKLGGEPPPLLINLRSLDRKLNNIQKKGISQKGFKIELTFQQRSNVLLSPKRLKTYQHKCSI